MRKVCGQEDVKFCEGTRIIRQINSINTGVYARCSLLSTAIVQVLNAPDTFPNIIPATYNNSHSPNSHHIMCAIGVGRRQIIDRNAIKCN